MSSSSKSKTNKVYVTNLSTLQQPVLQTNCSSHSKIIKDIGVSQNSCSNTYLANQKSQLQNHKVGFSTAKKLAALVLLLAIWFIIFQVKIATGAPCQRAKFPKILGGTQDRTIFIALDYYEYSLTESRLVAAGYSNDSVLLGGFVATRYAPIIQMYEANTSDNNFNSIWQKSFAINYFQFREVAFNTDGNKVAVLMTHYYDSIKNIIILTVISGYPELQLTYNGSYTEYYQYMGRNMIMGSSWIHFQSYYYSFQLVSIPIPFISANVWKRQSNSEGRPLGLIFGDSNAVIFAYGSSSDKQYITSYTASNGMINWIYGYADTSQHYSASLDYKRINATRSIIVAASGSYNVYYKLYSTFILDENGQVIETKVYQIQSTTNYDQIKGLQIVDLNKVRSILSYYFEYSIFLADVSFVSLTVIYRPVSPYIYYGGYFSHGKFSKNKIGTGEAYIAINSSKFYKGNGAYLTFSYYQGLIFSTNLVESCGTTYSYYGDYVYSITIESGKYPITDLTSLNLINAVTTTSFVQDPTTLTINDIDSSKTVNIDDQCLQKPYEFDLFPQTVTEFTTSITCTPQTISPKKATFHNVCDTTTAMPTLNFDTNSNTPSSIRVNSNTGDVVINATPPGKYAITIINYFYNLAQPTSQNIIINVINNPPAFSSSLAIKVALNSQTSSPLPSIIDLEGDAVTWTQDLTKLPSFVTFTAPDLYTFNPTKFSEVGFSKINIALSDSKSCVSNTYFTVEVINTAPYFTSDLTDQVIHVGMTSQYTLPPTVDDEGNAITITDYNKVSYASIGGGTITFNPTTSSHLGKSTCRLDLSDSQRIKSYLLNITVINDPPQFATPLTPILVTLALNQNLKYDLPQVTDTENHVLTITTRKQGDSILTTFIKVTKSGSTSWLDITPTAFTDVGTNIIEVVLSDPYTSTIYSFSVEVTNTAPYLTSTLQDQIIHIDVKTLYTLTTAKDDEGNAISISQATSILPTYASVNGLVITFTPATSSHLGKVQCSIDLTDSQLLSNSYIFQVTVINDPPYFASTPTPSVKIPLNSNLKYDLPQALDFENHALKIKAIQIGSTTLPSFIKLTQSGSTSWLDIAPTSFTELGTHSIQVSVADPYSETPYSIQVEVTNSAPYFKSSLQDQEIHIGLTSTYAISSSIADDEGNSVSISSTSILPSYATVNGLIITFTPNSQSHFGKVQCSIDITDSLLTARSTFYVKVINEAPQFLSSLTPIITVPLNKIQQYNLPTASDFENHAITITPSIAGNPNLPAFIKFTQTGSTGQFEFNPTALSDEGTHTIDISLSDPYDSTKYSFSVEVTNTAPYFTASLVDQEIHIDLTSTYTLPKAVDDQGNSISISLATSVLPSYASVNGLIITFLPNAQSHLGKVQCSLDLTDSSKFTTYTFYVTVINEPPQFALSLAKTIQVPLNKLEHYSLPQATDYENHVVTISPSTTLPSFIQFTQSGSTGQFGINPTAFSEVGSYSIDILLSDPYDSTKFSFSIEVTNTAPYFTQSLVDQEIHIDLTSTYTLPQAVDDEGNPITISTATSILPSFATVNGFIITFMPISPLPLGKVQCFIDLTDSQKTTTSTFYVTVINDPPKFTEPWTAAISVDLNKIAQYNLPATSDFENQALTITPSITGQPSLPSFITFTQSSPSGSFTFEPTAFTDVGNHTIDVSLADPYNSTKYRFNLEVKNSPPDFDYPPEDVDVQLDISTAIPLPSFHDPEGNTVKVLTVEAGKPKLPSFVSFNPSSNEYLVLTYDSYNIGVTTIEVILSDSQLQSPAYQFDINVKPRVVKEEQAKQLSKVMNAGPPKFIIWNDNEKIYLTADKAFEYTLPKAEDPDNDEIIANVLAGEAFGFTEYKNGVLLFNPKPSHVKQNPYTIKIVLEDQNPYFTKKSDEYKMQVFVEAAPVAASDEKEQQQQQQQQYQYVQVQQEKKEKNTAKFMQQVQQNEAEAAIRAQSISRDGLLKLKCINMQYNDILLKINQENIKIYLVSRLNIKEVNFTIVSIQKNFLEIQLYFDNPQTISSGSESDQIQLYFINPISNDKGDARILSTASINQMVLIRKGFVIKLKVPPQNIPGSIKTFTVIKKAIGVSSYIEFSDSVASNKFLSLFLLFMWSLLRDMSQLTMMSLLPLNIPGNVQSIVSIILNFVYLDIFFSNDWLLTWFDFDPENDRPISPQFDDVGLFSMNLVANLGTGLLLLIAQALILVIQTFISLLAKIMPICNKPSEYLDRKLKWNFYLRLFYYQFQPLFIASLINLQSLRYTTKIELNSSVISLLFIPISLLVIFIVAKQLRKLDKSEQSQQISCLINGISERTRFSYMNWNLIMLIRQIVIIIVLVMLRDYVVLQIQLLLQVALFVQMIVVHTRPFTSTTDNLVLFLNEFLISVYLYLVIALLYLSDPPLAAEGDQQNEEIALEYLNTKQMAAWALLATILLTISMNLTLFFQQLFKNVRRNKRVQSICRKRWQKQIAVSKKQRIHNYADQSSSTINQDNSSILESHIYDPQYLSQSPYKGESSPSKQYDPGAFNYLDLIKFQNNILASPPQKLEKSNEEFKESKMFSSIVPKEQQLGNKNQQHNNKRIDMEFRNILENKREIEQQQQKANINLYDNHQSSNNLQNNDQDAALQLMTQVKVKLKQSQKFQPNKRGNLPKPILQKVHIQPTAIQGEAIQRQVESIWEEEPEIIKRNDKGKTIQNSLWH